MNKDAYWVKGDVSFSFSKRKKINGYLMLLLLEREDKKNLEI